MICGAVPLVAAALGDEVDNGAGRSAEFGLEVRGLYLERLHGLHRDRLFRQAAPEQVAGNRIVVLCRVDHGIDGPDWAVAIDGERRVRRVGEADTGSLIADRPVIPPDIRGQHGDAGHLWWCVVRASHAVGRDALDLVVRGNHRYLLGHGAELKANVADDLLAGDQLKVLDSVGAEAIPLNGQAVGAGVDPGQPVESCRGAYDLRDRARPERLEGDGCIGDGSAGRIENTAGQRSRADLGNCLAAAEQAGRD